MSVTRVIVVYFLGSRSHGPIGQTSHASYLSRMNTFNTVSHTIHPSEPHRKRQRALEREKERERRYEETCQEGVNIRFWMLILLLSLQDNIEARDEQQEHHHRFFVQVP